MDTTICVVFPFLSMRTGLVWNCNSRTEVTRLYLAEICLKKIIVGRLDHHKLHSLLTDRVG